MQKETLVESLGVSEGAKKTMEMAEEARNINPSDRPSFGKELFLGNFVVSMIDPFPIQSAEDKAIGDAYIAKIIPFLRQHLDPDEVDESREIPPGVIRGLKDLGAFAMKIPKEYDGLGFSQTNFNRVLMKVGSFCGGTATLLSAHQSIGVPQPLVSYGTEEQKRKFLPRFRKGAISAFALTEPDVGSDPGKMTCEAILSDDGKYYLLNGEKLWCTNGTIADIIVVMARTGEKISAFVLEMNSKGVEIVQRCEFMGLGGLYNGFLRFTNVKIPAENLILGEGRGLALALGTINIGRLTIPASTTGAAKQCLKICRVWGNSRVQWGQPIGYHETGRVKIAFIAATTFAMEATTWLTSAWKDEDRFDIRIEAAMAKYFCTESMWKISDLTMQLRGGRGYEKARSLKFRGEDPYPVERIMRDCRILTILEGTSEIMKLFLAREAIDPHFKLGKPLLKGDVTFKNVWKVFKFYSWWFPKQFLGGLWRSSYKSFGPLATHCKFIESNAHKMARQLFMKMVKHQQKLENKQLVLGRLMDIATDLFVMSASVSYAKSLKKKSAIELADTFCTLARRRINENFRALSDNDDHLTNLTAKEVLEGEMLWLEEGTMDPF